MRGGCFGAGDAVADSGGAGGKLDEDLLGFVFAEGEVVAADFDFYRVAQRRKADEFHFRADEQAHFHQARPGSRRQFDLGDGGGVANGNGGERLGVSRHGALSGNRFD